MVKGIASFKLGQSRRLIGCIILCLILSTASGCNALLDRVLSKDTNNPNFLLGNPSGANAFNANDYLISRPQYVLSYNRDQGIPNWVSWQLNQSWLGLLPRIPFEPDSSLPKDWYQVMPGDYTGSGFDRGHMVPAADRDKTEADAKAAFLMTNILPQAPDNNRGPWEKLESYCRELVKQGKELYIVAGGAGSGGAGEKGKRTAIARGKVVVPASTWKIVVILDRSGLGLSGITENTSIIAVNIPNRQGIKESNWKDFRTSVDQIEELTGYNFLSNLSEPIQTIVEAKLQ
jgi:endonuclease G